jgi:Zn-dependent protease
MSADPTRPDDSNEPPEVFDASLADEAALDPSLDPLTTATLHQLEQAPEERTWVQNASLLAVSLLIFVMTGFFNNEPIRLILLIAVLLFHELGHYAGMRLFNYQNVRMFFIPLFGAAVAGRSRSVEGYKEAIVLLLGPLPGIVLGVALGIAALFYDSEALRSAAMLLLVINGFNLLPFMPLDGGRLLHLVLFSRQPILEAVFRVVTGVLLALCGWAMGAWILAAAGVFIVLGTGYTFRVSRVAQMLRGPLAVGGEMDLSARIPREQAVPLIELVRKRFPQLNQPKQLANTVRQVWERIHLRPPGVAATLGLLLLHGGGFLLAPVTLIALSVPWPTVVSRPDADGNPIRTREVRAWGHVQRSTELDAQDRPHGRHQEFFPGTGKLKVEGAYEHGLRDGAWKWYGADGQLESTQVYRRGQPVDPADAPNGVEKDDFEENGVN